MIVRNINVNPKRSHLIWYTKGNIRLNIQHINKGLVKIFFPKDFALIENTLRFCTIVIIDCDKGITTVSKVAMLIFEVEKSEFEFRMILKVAAIDGM